MEDILDIYEPVVRESLNIIPILIGLSAIFLTTVLVILFLKRQKRKVVSSEEIYKNCVDKYRELKQSLTGISSYDFANEVNSLLKNFMTELLKKDYLHTTTEEFVNKLESFNVPLFNESSDFLINYLQPAMYGNKEISEENKNKILGNFVEIITHIFNTRRDEDV